MFRSQCSAQQQSYQRGIWWAPGSPPPPKGRGDRLGMGVQIFPPLPLIGSDLGKRIEMENKIRAHDGIVGATYMLSVILGAAVSTQWLWIAGIVAGLQIISPVTRFCPVYFVLNKMMPDTEPVQSGRRK